jgi:3,4-dihydroxy 2-butanone 4-phosphate synthase/GTP cyclohydrolase II
MNKINKILEDLRQGKPIIVVDNLDRENEGDIVIAAEKANEENILFAMKYAGGLMCLPCDGTILDRLGIPMMFSNHLDKFSTPFTVSIDASAGGTGVSLSDRLKTIQVLLDDNSRCHDLLMPGHLFPLRPRPKLLQERQGHTESSIELMKLAGLKPVAVIVEIVDDDGSMAKGNRLTDYAKKHNLNMISVPEIQEAVYGQKSI